MNNASSTSKKKWTLPLTATDWISLVIYTIIISTWVFSRNDISNSQIMQLTLHKEVCRVLSAAGITISSDSNGQSCTTTLPYQRENFLIKHSTIYYQLGGTQQEFHLLPGDVISAHPIDGSQS